MRTVLPYVANLHGQRVGQLMLNREVPLLTEGRLKVLIRDPDPESCGRRARRIASEVDSRARHQGSVATLRSGTQIMLCVNPERRIHGELLVGASAFEEIGNRVAETNHGLAAQGCGGPCQAKAGLPIASPQVVVEESPVTELRACVPAVRSIDGPGKQTEVHLPVCGFIQRRVVFKPQAEVQGYGAGYPPVVLDVAGQNVS